jgi:GT2 family glycosyltransferase
MSSEDLGVVAIGRNEGDRLVACLTSIIDTDGPKVVYVDSGSIDGSIAFAEQIGASVVELDLTQPFTAARARNEGFSALRSRRPNLRFIQFIDGDCGLAPGWLAEARAFIEQRNDVAVVFGRRRERHPEASIYNYLCDLEWNTPIGEAVACGGDALVRVEAFQAVGGFRSELIAGEEPELCVRLREKGWKIWRLDAEMTEHDAGMTRFQQFWIRAVRAGYAYANVSWIHRNSAQGIWRRETLRAVFWAGLLPAAIALGTLLHPAALLGLSVYFVQICRIALRDKSPSYRPSVRALLLTLSKFAEFQGILKFLWRKRRHGAATLIEYK